MIKERRTISIADQIFEQLEKDILSGKYAKGEAVSELRLSEELGVSRTPVREALRRLEQEKLLEESSRGTVVVGISREDMLDMYEIRERIEGLAAYRAAGQISEEDIKAMRETVELQRFYSEKSSGDYSDQIKELDSRFHNLLYSASGSRPLADMLTSLHKRMAKYRMASVSDPDRAILAVEEHEAIVRALAAHDPAAAEAALTTHMEHSRDRMVDMEIV